MSTAKIIYTHTDEAPALATYSLLPIIKAFTQAAGIVVETRDISLAGRILASFPDSLTADRRQPDDLAELGALAKTAAANIIKLPNISASIPQLKDAIKELQRQGYGVPDYPEDPQNDAEKQVKAKYAKVLGSAVNPVLREGNSDRRVALSVKQYAKKHPHSMGAWSKDSRTHVASMSGGDFYANEQSAVIAQGGKLRVELADASGTVTVLKDGIIGHRGRCHRRIDDQPSRAAGVLRERDRRCEEQGGAAVAASEGDDDEGVRSDHVRARRHRRTTRTCSTSMRPCSSRSASIPTTASVTSTRRFRRCPPDKRAAIEADLQAVYATRPALAMVDSSKGITNLHVPSDVIIDASMPAAVRASGQMWGPDGKLHDMKAMIPDRCYAGIYQATIDDCRQHGAFDVPTMGTVSNVGLMAQSAEEYGSHDKTFEIPSKGTVRVSDSGGRTLFEHSVEEGDIWRMCRTRDLPIRDWVKLAVTRARATGHAAIFWLDENRAYDRNVIEKTRRYLKDHDTRASTFRSWLPSTRSRPRSNACEPG